jgi:HemY protein
VRILFWVVAIFALAAGLVAVGRYYDGYVLLVAPPYRIETSLNLLIAALIALFVLAHLLLRAVSAAVQLPARVREYRAARRREKARAMLLEALREYFSGRYARAEKAAAASIGPDDHGALAAVIAARAAHGLRAFERRDSYLAQCAALAPEGDAVAAVTRAELLLDQRRFEEALDALAALPQKHTAALRLELRARQLARDWPDVLRLVDQLEKRGVLEPAQASQLRSFAQAENLRRGARDAAALEEAWNKVPARQRKDTRIAHAAAQCFLALGNCAQAHRVIEESLATAWDGALAALYAECEGDFPRRIERAESWLRQHADDAPLLLALGRLCAQQELWGKAQNYLEASVSMDPTHAAHMALGELNERLGNSEAAQRHFRESLRLAVARLKQLDRARPEAA